jgi:hypothetical protein
MRKSRRKQVSTRDLGLTRMKFLRSHNSTTLCLAINLKHLQRANSVREEEKPKQRTGLMEVGDKT